MGLFDFFKRKTLADEIREHPYIQHLQTMREMMCADGWDADELPNGTGEFGLEPSNPIPTCLAIGSRSYLGRLRTEDHRPVRHKRLGTVHHEVSPHPIDVYEISTEDGHRLCNLYISMYHKKISARAPKGFRTVFSK